MQDKCEHPISSLTLSRGVDGFAHTCCYKCGKRVRIVTEDEHAALSAEAKASMVLGAELGVGFELPYCPAVPGTVTLRVFETLLVDDGNGQLMTVPDHTHVGVINYENGRGTFRIPGITGTYRYGVVSADGQGGSTWPVCEKLKYSVTRCVIAENPRLGTYAIFGDFNNSDDAREFYERYDHHYMPGNSRCFPKDIHKSVLHSLDVVACRVVGFPTDKETLRTLYRRVSSRGCGSCSHYPNTEFYKHVHSVLYTGKEDQ